MSISIFSPTRYFLISGVVLFLLDLFSYLPGSLLTVICLVDIIATFKIFMSDDVDDPIFKLFLILFSYYCYALFLNDINGLIDVSKIAFVQTLKTKGLVPNVDIARFLYLSILFKNTFLYFFYVSDKNFNFNKAVYSSRFSNGNLWYIEALLVVLFILSMTLPYGPISFFMILSLCILAINFYCLSFDKSSIKALFMLILVILLSFWITRSRNVISVVLSFAIVNSIAVKGVRSTRTMLIICLSFLAISGYGVLRAVRYNDQPLWQIIDTTLSGEQGIEALGESGSIFLVGSHLVGLASRNQLPDEIQDNLESKLLRIVPLIEKDEMLADRYVKYFYPTFYEQGGGFAFPLVAELFIYAGALGVVLGASLIAKSLAFFFSKSSDLNSVVLGLYVIVKLTRQELSGTVYVFMLGLVFIKVIDWFGATPNRIRCQTVVPRKLIM